MQKAKKLPLFSMALMSIVLGSAFAVSNILEKWRVRVFHSKKGVEAVKWGYLKKGKGKKFYFRE